MSFETDVRRIQDLLEHATDEQLAFSRITPKGRDELMKKPLRFVHTDTEDTFPLTRVSPFNMRASYFQKETVLSYNKKIMNDPEQTSDMRRLVLAARSQYQAAHFWGQSDFRKNVDVYAPLYGMAAAITGSLGILPFKEHFDLLAGLLATGICAPYYTISSKMYYNTQRFGNLFNPFTYDPLPEKSDGILDKINTALSPNTKKECLGKNYRLLVDENKNLFLKMLLDDKPKEKDSDFFVVGFAIYSHANRGLLYPILK